jgi:hypothetical protein
MYASIMRRILLGALPCVFVATQLFAAPAEDAAKKAVFQIGAFDRSSVEFASGDPSAKVEFVVSKSKPEKDWYGYQPAASGAAAKAQDATVATAPRSISFSLEGSPVKAYRLHIALLVEGASVPALRVSIDGRNGIFYLHPKLDYSNGDQGDSFYPAYSSADVEFVFPGSYLRAGANAITLQPVEESEETVPGAGVTYDAIELDSLTTTGDSLSASAQLMPTVFFTRRQGELQETLEAFIQHNKAITPGTGADLVIGNKHYHTSLSGGHDFGEEKATFQVSDFQPQTEARLTAKIDGHEEHFKQTIDPKKKWTVLIVPHIHVDIGYSDYQAKIAAIQSRTVDEAMDMTANHPEFRFSLDGEWDLEQFLSSRSTAQQQRAIEALQKKQLFVPAQYVNLLTGLPTTETLIRSLYPSANFSRKYGTPMDYANITDVPSWSWSYASILASAGIDSLAGGSNNYRAPVLLQGRLNENSPIWWVGPDNKRVLVWYSRIYQQMQALFGLPPVLQAGRDSLPLFLQQYEHPGYHANAAILYGTQVENTDLFPQQAELAKTWNSLYAYPHFEYKGFHEAIKTIADQFGDNIPTMRGDGGPYWEDGAGSDAYYVAMERWTEGRAQTAEKFATLASLVDPRLKVDTSELGAMWKDMVLMDEHTWGAYNSQSDPTSMEATGQLAIKDQFAVNARAEVDFVAKRGMANLADAIPAGPGSTIVFNSLNWKRSGPVSMDIDKGSEIVDLTTNQVVPYELLFTGPNFQHVRFVAEDIPASGYKVYVMRSGKQAAAAPVAEQKSTLESPYYKVELDAETGAVRSIYDKQLQRELVSKDGPYRFGEFLYVTGGDKGPNTLLQYNRVYPKAVLEVHRAHGGKIVSVETTPSGQVAHLESQNTNTPSIKAEIRLFDHEKKIEFVEDLDKTEVITKEAAYFAFPFAMTQPQFKYEIQNGVIDPAKDMYPGAGHEWFSAQHWVTVEQDGVAATVMPLDAPLITLGDINRGEWPEKFENRTGSVFSYVMNNYWDTNYRAGQGGHFTFHYEVTSAPSTQAADLSRMGWEAITPLEADTVTPQDKALTPAATTATSAAPQPSAAATTQKFSMSLDGKQQSFLDVEDANVLLETWKPAEDGNGTILRLLDFGGMERTVTVRIPSLHLASVTQTDAVERGQTAIPLSAPGQFSFNLHPHEIVTLRLVEGSK